MITSSYPHDIVIRYGLECEGNNMRSARVEVLEGGTANGVILGDTNVHKGFHHCRKSGIGRFRLIFAGFPPVASFCTRFSAIMARNL